MASANTVNVKNISAQTDDKEIRDFFAFCGKITDLKVTSEGDSKSATVTFEKEHAAKTALLLNNTQLGQAHISVTSSGSSGEAASGGAHSPDRDSDEITQDDKPRIRIFAEYLAHGYVIGDAALERAIDLDKQHNLSSRFLSTLQNIDKKYHATDRAKTADHSYGISSRAGSLFSGIGSYFEKAANTPTGKRVVGFYTEGQRQVQDIHAEARRLADLKKEEHGSAYKAAGLERVFGAEKPKQEPASQGTGVGPAAVPGTTAATAGATTTEKIAPVEPAPKS